jgi:sugar phosphate isomerase/epimerase
MYPSISTSYLKEWDPYAMVQCFAGQGWQSLELHDIHGYALLSGRDPERVGLAFKRFAADHGVSFPQGHLYVARRDVETGETVWFDIAPADDQAFAGALDEIKRWIDFFNALGIKAGVLHPGGSTLEQNGWSPERILERRVEALQAIAEHAEGGPTVVCLENLAEYGIPTVEGLLQVISLVGSDRLGICLDTGHAHLSGADIPAFIAEAGSRLKALHIGDNGGRTDDHLLPYGYGTIEWEPVLQALRAIGYSGPLNLEIPGENKCPKPIRLAKLKYALELAERMIALSAGLASE